MNSELQTNILEEISTFYIQATESILERWPRTLKHGDMFALFDQLGDVIEPKGTPGGIFHDDTRHLSHLELRIQGQRPLLLSSTVEDDNVIFRADLTNPDIYSQDRNEVVLPRESIHFRRSKFLWNGKYYERIAIHNFDTCDHKCIVTIKVGADFTDLFEIRGLKRTKRGRCRIEEHESQLDFLYTGVDQRVRRTHIAFDPPPQSLDNHTAYYVLTLKPHQQVSLFVTVDCNPVPRTEAFSAPYREARREARASMKAAGSIGSANEFVQEIFERAAADIRMLCTCTPFGPYPYAGTPWFNTAFGRDGIITALIMLWRDPTIAKGVLRYLAATQATATDAASDAEPGKILHEIRRSEMALLKEVPFGQYYGSVDSTPLFVMLAGRYYARTGDLETIRALWPNIRAALDWIARYGDRDGDGFVEYFRESEDGLINQGWKDSHDSVSHDTGELAKGPIALCEVQGYVYAAYSSAADLARVLDERALAEDLARRAEKLRTRFEEAFWCEDIGVYALALDGQKRPCKVVSSNAGQVLASGIASTERAKRVASAMLGPDCYSGWGIRTLATSAARYNPMSYHNGSVWPHDNAMIALGFGRYGLREEAAKLFKGIFDAGCHIDLMRYPELFCGFARRRGTPPTLYPVACSPQAWASVAPFAFLEACLGIECDGVAREIRIEKPLLPSFAEALDVRNLGIRGASVDLDIRCVDGGTAILARPRDGHIDVKVTR